MTWSITKPALHGGKPVLRWNDKPLRALSDAEFETATRAAEALGDDIVDSAAAGSRDPHVLMADQAAEIVMAIMREMTRREERKTNSPEPK